jgi:hypothetical protein
MMSSKLQQCADGFCHEDAHSMLVVHSVRSQTYGSRILVGYVMFSDEYLSC